QLSGRKADRTLTRAGEKRADGAEECDTTDLALGVDRSEWLWHDPRTPRSGAWRPGMATVHSPELRAIQSSDLPPSLPAWLPHLWSRVLFPGRGPADSRLRWIGLLLLLILPGALLYPCLSFHLFEPDEGRYAEIAREMVAHDEWIVPVLEGE